MIGKLLCFFGIHKWRLTFSHCRCDHYWCERCDTHRTDHY